MKFLKTKHKMLHPYAKKSDSYDISRMIEAEVIGEHVNGIPHG